MVRTLITLGIACLLSAVIGGGFKGLGVEIPILRSGGRQVMLAIAGAILLGSAAVVYRIQHLPDPELELSLGLESYDARRFSIALHHVAAAAQVKNHEAEYHYGEMLFHGEGCVPNRKEGIRWVSRAAESGYAPAEAFLAMIYYEGLHGIEKDLKKSRVWADRSAAQDDPIGLYYVAVFETDDEKKRTAMYESASRGFAPAQRELAMFLVLHPTIPGKFSKSDAYDSLFWLQKAALQGEPNAQVRLAQINFQGAKKVSPDSDTATRLAEAYALVGLALERHDNRFPLSDQLRGEGLALREQIEALLPQDVQLRVLNSNKSWQAKLDLPYRHGVE